jgi:hypothetical protein
VLRVEDVDLPLQALDVPGGDRRLGPRAVRRSGQLRLGDEQLVLEATDDRPDLRQRRRQLESGEGEPGAELVVGAVGADAGGILPYARTTGKTGRSAVARAGVETRDALASGRPGSSSRGELNPWTGQNEMWSTSLCLAS